MRLDFIDLHWGCGMSENKRKWGTPELTKWGLLHNNDPMVVAITKRWQEARGKNARWCERISKLEAKLDEARKLACDLFENIRTDCDDSELEWFYEKHPWLKGGK